MSFYILLAFVLGWIVAQGSKIAIALIIRKGKLSKKELLDLVMKSGGMPSAHTACFIAATLTIGFRAGFDSAVFALAVCTAAIIIYDATNVRYAVGQQGKLLNKIVSIVKTQTARPLKLVEGHTIQQVAVGFVIGVIIAILLQLVTVGYF